MERFVLDQEQRVTHAAMNIINTLAFEHCVCVIVTIYIEKSTRKRKRMFKRK
jgi:hypothetical protein